MNLRNVGIGALLGGLAGALDVAPMIAQGLPLTADLSAFSMWVVIGIFLATSSLKVPSPLHGILTAFLALLPSAILIGAQEPVSLVPIAVMTLILGAGLGWAVRRFAKPQ